MDDINVLVPCWTVVAFLFTLLVMAISDRRWK